MHGWQANEKGACARPAEGRAMPENEPRYAGDIYCALAFLERKGGGRCEAVFFSSVIICLRGCENVRLQPKRKHLRRPTAALVIFLSVASWLLALPPERSLPHASLSLWGIYAGSSVIRIRADSYRNRRLRTVPGSEPISKYPLHKRHTSARCTKETCLICIKKIFPAFRQGSWTYMDCTNYALPLFKLPFPVCNRMLCSLSLRGLCEEKISAK